MKQKLLVTGHRGLLGSACVRLFRDRFDVVTSEDIDLRRERETSWLLSAHKPDIVIHCAAKVGGVKANRDFPVEFLTDNLLIQTNTINAAAQNGVGKLVFIGTSCMFPRDAALPVVEESLLTGKLEDSVEAYAIAKLAGWRLCKAHFEEYGRKFITVNPSNIYGVNDNYSERAHVVPALIRRIWENRRSDQTLDVWGDGSAVREFIYVDDAVAGIECALDHWDSPEVLSIGTGRGTTIYELVTELYGKMHARCSINWDKTKPTGIPRKTFDTTKLQSLGWSPKYCLSHGLELAVNDFLANHSQKTS